MNVNVNSPNAKRNKNSQIIPKYYLYKSPQCIYALVSWCFGCKRFLKQMLLVFQVIKVLKNINAFHCLPEFRLFVSGLPSAGNF